MKAQRLLPNTLLNYEYHFKGRDLPTTALQMTDELASIQKSNSPQKSTPLTAVCKSCSGTYTTWFLHLVPTTKVGGWDCRQGTSLLDRPNQSTTTIPTKIGARYNKPSQGTARPCGRRRVSAARPVPTVNGEPGFPVSRSATISHGSERSVASRGVGSVGRQAPSWQGRCTCGRGLLPDYPYTKPPSSRKCLPYDSVAWSEEFRLRVQLYVHSPWCEGDQHSRRIGG